MNYNCQGDNYITVWFLGSYSYFSIITLDLSKWQVPDADPRTIQQISFTGNLDKAGNTNTFLFKRSKRNYNRFKHDSNNYNECLAEKKLINL